MATRKKQEAENFVNEKELATAMAKAAHNARRKINKLQE